MSGGHEGALAAALIELAERTRTRWCVSNDPRYLDGAGRLVHDLLTANRADVCVNTAASWGLLLPNGEWRLKSPAEMARCGRAGRRAGCDARDRAGLCALRPALAASAAAALPGAGRSHGRHVAAAPGL
jgi:hypothetical protein